MFIAALSTGAKKWNNPYAQIQMNSSKSCGIDCISDKEKKKLMQSAAVTGEYYAGKVSQKGQIQNDLSCGS